MEYSIQELARLSGVTTRTLRWYDEIGLLKPSRVAESGYRYYGPAEVDRLYINFCDPWPKSNQKRRRLTHGNFLKCYRQVLPMGGQIHFKTDNDKLFQWSVEEIPQYGFALSEVTRDLHADGPVGVMTDYEAKFYELGKNINRCVATMEPWTEPEEEPAEAAPLEASSVE